MTLEHDSKSEENCNLRSAKAGHSSNICLSSPVAPVLHCQAMADVSMILLYHHENMNTDPSS